MAFKKTGVVVLLVKLCVKILPAIPVTGLPAIERVQTESLKISTVAAEESVKLTEATGDVP